MIVLPRLIIGEVHRFPDLARFYKENVLDRGLGLIACLHRRGAESNEFRPQDSDAVARLVVAPVLLMAIWRTGLAEAWPNLWPLILFLLVVATVSVMRYRQTLE